LPTLEEKFMYFRTVS